MRQCFATVCTPDFVPGTLVLLHSFLRTNPWFSGDLIVIHDALPQSEKKKLNAIGRPVSFLQVCKPTLQRLQALIKECPKLTSRTARFYSIEAFRLQGYNRVLFCDSDMLFRDSIEELFSLPHSLIACADGPNIRGTGRDVTTFEEKQTRLENTLENTFNAGLMLLSDSLLTTQNHNNLLAMLNKDVWKPLKTGHTDQALYNMLFHKRQHIVDGSYNFLMSFKDDHLLNGGLNLKEAKAIHFNGPVKPWMPARTRGKAGTDSDIKHALKLWYLEYAAAIGSGGNAP